MATTLAQLIGPLCILLAIVLVAWVAKIFLERQRNAKKAMNHIWVQTIPKAGKEINDMVPIEQGQIKVKIGKRKIIHIIGEPGEFNADWPPGKIKFVQTTVPKIIYYEGDIEPISNVTDRPIVSAQAITNIIDGVATSSAEAMRKSYEESGNSMSAMPRSMMWLYVCIGVLFIVSLTTMIISIQNDVNPILALMQQIKDFLVAKLGMAP